MKLEIKDNRVTLRLSLQDQAAAAAAASAAKAEKALSSIYTSPATGTEITFDRNKVYHLPASPGTGPITQRPDGAIFGLSQKVYHQDDTIPSLPETWVRMGGSYDTGQLNTIFVEWISPERQEYWILKDNPISAEDVATAKAIEAAESANEAKKIAKRYNFITPNMFVNEGMTDQQKIQEALWWARQKKKSLYIPWNEERESDVWLLDEAVLLDSNSIIYIDNARLKLSDIARDNIFRSVNCGIGIENPFENPLHNISIIGVGNAVIEGADNPRSTGDSGKTLTIETVPGNFTYGTDSLNPGAKQTGDWRNIGIILGYTTGIKIQGLKCRNLHAYAISCERSKSGIIRDIELDGDEFRTISGVERIVKNNDGINLRYSGSDFLIENITGFSGDDPVALTTLNLPSPEPAGSLNTITATGDIFDPDTDIIHDVQIQNIKAGTYANLVRLLNVNGTKMYNINIRDVTDASNPEKLKKDPTGACVVLGSNSPVYGGPTPLGDCKNITIDNVKCINNRFAVRVEGSISESSVTNIRKYSSDLQPVSYPPVYFSPQSAGSRNLYRANIYTDDVLVSSPSDAGSWVGNSEDGKLTIFNGPINLADNYSGSFGDLSLVNKKFVTDLIPATIYTITQVPAILDAVMSRASTEGFDIPSAESQQAIKEMIGFMMATGSWDKLDLFLNFAYNNPSLIGFSRINWKNPAGPLAILEDTLTPNLYGLKGDGTTGYIRTGFNPFSGTHKYTLNNAGRGGVLFSASFTVFDGVSGNNANSMIIGNNAIQRINSSVNLEANVELSGIGYKGINRDNNQDLRIYSGSAEYFRKSPSTEIFNAEQVILRRNAVFSPNGISMYHMGASLSKTETEGLRSAYNSFLVKLGLNPIA